MPLLPPVQPRAPSNAHPAAFAWWWKQDGDAPEIGPIGEFVDALEALRRGHILVQVSDSSGGWLLNGAAVYTAHRSLVYYGLVQPYANPHGFAGIHYFRLAARGHEVARTALAQWSALPLLQRIWLRLVA